MLKVGRIARVKMTGDLVMILDVLKSTTSGEAYAYDVLTPDYRRVQLFAFELEAADAG